MVGILKWSNRYLQWSLSSLSLCPFHRCCYLCFWPSVQVRFFLQAAVFRCHLCSSAFAYKYERTKHLRRFHKVGLYLLLICLTLVTLLLWPLNCIRIWSAKFEFFSGIVKQNICDLQDHAIFVHLITLVYTTFRRCNFFVPIKSPSGTGTAFTSVHCTAWCSANVLTVSFWCF